MTKTSDIKFQIVKDTFRVFFAPTLVSAIALSIISITDMAIAGQLLGGRALSAISICYPIVLLVLILSSLFGMGSAIRLSTLMGIGDKKGSNIVASNAITLTIITTIILGVLGLVFIRPVLHVCGATNDALLEMSASYLRPILIGLSFMVLSPVVMTLLRNDSKPRLSMTIVLSCGAINLILDILLGRKMGLAGIAWATVIAETLTVIIGLYFLYIRGKNFQLARPHLSVAQIKAITLPGLPLAMIFALQAILTAFINNVLMSCGGEMGVAVYAILKNLICFIYAFFDGVTGSMQPMLGIYYGAREYKNVNNVVKVAFKYMAVITLGLFAILEIFAPFICGIFGAEGELLTSASTALRIQACFCITAGFIATINAYYRCTGREKQSLRITILDNLIFDIPAILIAKAVMGGSMYSVFVGLILTDILTLIYWFISAKATQKKTGAGHLILMDEIEENPCIFENTFLADDHDISVLIDELQQAIENADINMKKEYYINLCMEELVVNVLQLSTDKKGIYVDVAIHQLPDDKIQLRIRDNLVQFDPTQTGSGDVLEAAEEEAFNSMGLEIVKKIAVEYDYKRTIGMNDFRVIL